MKNIILIFFFTSYLNKLVYCGRKTNAEQHLNKIDKTSIQVCATKLYTSFGFDTNKRCQNRIIIPKLAFQHIGSLNCRTENLFLLYSKLKTEKGGDLSMEQKYFLHIHGLLHADVNMKTPKQWCKESFGDSADNDKYIDCYEDLHKYHLDSDNTTEVLKHAYVNLAYVSFKPEDTKAHTYFVHILSNLRCVDGEQFMTPTEICEGKTKSIIKKRKGQNSDDELESSPSKFPKI